MNFYYKIIVLVFLYLPYFQGWGQTQDSDTTEAYRLLQIATELNSQNLYDSAIYYFTASGNAYRKAGMDGRVLEAFNNVGILHIALNRLEVGRKHLDSIIQVAENEFPTFIDEQALAHIYLGVYYANLGDFDSTLHAYKRALYLQNQSSNPSYYDMIMAYSNIGSSLNERGYYQQAITYLDTALNISEWIYGRDEVLGAIICNNLGFSYSGFGDYGKAEKYYLKANQIDRICLGEDNPNIAVTYLNLARCIQENGDYEKAGEYFESSLKTFEKYLGPQHPRVASTLTNIGFNLRLRQKLKESEKYLRRGLSIKKKNLAEDHFSIGISLGHLAFTLAELGQLDSAISLFEKNIDIYEKAYGEKHPNVARIHRELGRVYRKNNQPEKSYQSIIKAIEGVSGIPIASRYDFPELDSVILHSELIFAFYDLGMQYKEDYEKGGNIEDLKASLKSFYQAQALNDGVRRSYRSFASKEILSAKTDVIYDNGVRVALRLHQKTGEASYLNDAFFFSEKKKSLILLEGVKDIEAKNFARVNPELIEQEAKLKAELAYFDKKYYQEKIKATIEKDEPASTYRDSIFDITLRLNRLLSQVERDNPEYYRLKYIIDPPSLSTLQKEWLNPDQGILSFLQTSDTIYTFLIKKDEVKINRFALDFPLETWIKELRSGIFDYFSHASPSSDSFEEYAELYSQRGYDLYKTMLHPFVEDLPPKLVIIPDGILGLIPFEALLSRPPDEMGRFDQYPYLIRDYQISYGLSASLISDHTRGRNSRKTRGGLLAFAPEFHDAVFSISEGETVRDYRLVPLVHNQIEVRKIKSIMGKGKVFMGNDATVERFKTLASDYSLIHIATHAYINDDNPNFSFLAFTNDSSGEEASMLYLRDLYALALNSEMVVLSACETGVGKVLKGEGMASLARGFSFAGVNSLITSLWSVNDAITAELMEGFYHHINRDEPKDQALRQAKLDYLAKKDSYMSHPFYWAPFIAIGDTNPISPAWQWGDWILLGLLGAVIIWLFFKMTRTLIISGTKNE